MAIKGELFFHQHSLKPPQVIVFYYSIKSKDRSFPYYMQMEE